MVVFDRFMYAFRPVFAPTRRSICSKVLLFSAAGLSMATSSAQATWSILIADTRTGEIVIASATCVETIDLRRSTPVLITGVGAVTAQSAVDTSGNNRMLIRDRLLQRVPLESVLDELSGVDNGHLNRQYGFITADGGSLTYSGVQNADWAGGVTGRIEMGRPGPQDDLVYSVQGNILSGPNVVQDAVDALIETDSDLPGRLMAAMRAAQIGGGDGRCSCSNNDPTGCGSPPPGPFKSAHVGYMLGTRADDIDAVRAYYPITNNAGGMALIDINHDGMNDVVVGDAINDELSIFINSAMQGDPLSHVINQEVRTLSASGVVGISTGDFNEDGFDDIAIALTTPPTLEVLMGQDDGTLSSSITYELSGAPTGIDAGNLFDGSRDQIAVSIGSISSIDSYSLSDDLEPVVLLNSRTKLDSTPGYIALGSLGDEQLNSVVLADPSSNTVSILLPLESGGSPSLSVETTLTTAANPIGIEIADLDLDGVNEIVVLSGSSRRTEVFAQTGNTWARTNEISINRDGRGLSIGDLNNDGLPDIVTASSSPQRNLQVFVNDGKGDYIFDDIVRVGANSRFVELVDMNANGDLDLVIANQQQDGLMLIDNPRGAPLPFPGRFADGDYFLELNVANQRQADPDPVDQLADMFETWRSGLEGRIDAVRTVVTGRNRVANGMSSTVIVDLRDWRGDRLSIDEPLEWELISTSKITMVTQPVLKEPGIYELNIQSKGILGDDSIVLRVGSGADRVRLMPDFSVSVVQSLADFNNDGKLNFFDVTEFLEVYNDGDLDADFTGDGVLNFFDIADFLENFKG
jgi:Family of unknown function (DUF1028)/FG-GAP-like repeat